MNIATKINVLDGLERSVTITVPKQGYKFNYKPENPEPSVGPVHTNSMWGMKL